MIFPCRLDKPVKQPPVALLVMCVAVTNMSAAQDLKDRRGDAAALPDALPGFQIEFFAREPVVRNPCAMAFDFTGRLFFGMGPQYRNPVPDTPGDSGVFV
ncbi:MAG: hypothetical protein VB858_02010 [Planctomycetaceae bacterium]